MRKVAVIFLLSVMCFYVAGIFPLYHFSDYQLKKNFLHKVSNNAEGLSKLYFTQQQFKNLVWDEAFEFTFNGNKFDVVSIHHDSDKITVTGFFDTDEDALVKALETINGFTSEKSKRAASFFKVLTLDFISTKEALTFILNGNFIDYRATTFGGLSFFKSKIIKPPAFF